MFVKWSIRLSQEVKDLLRLLTYLNLKINFEHVLQDFLLSSYMIFLHIQKSVCSHTECTFTYNRVYVHIKKECMFTYKQRVRSHTECVYVHIQKECTFAYEQSVRSHTKSRRYMAGILPVRRKIQNNQSIHHKNQCYSIVLGVSSVDHFLSNIPHVQIPN